MSLIHTTVAIAAVTAAAKKSAPPAPPARARNGVPISDLAARLRWMVDHGHDLNTCLSSAEYDGSLSAADVKAVRREFWNIKF